MTERPRTAWAVSTLLDLELRAGDWPQAEATLKRAEKLKKMLEETGKIDDHYRHYPVQVWRLGEQVIWVALGGEVVVDYSRRLKKELAGDADGRVRATLEIVWMSGWAPHESQQKPLKPGSAEISLAKVLKTKG